MSQALAAAVALGLLAVWVADRRRPTRRTRRSPPFPAALVDPPPPSLWPLSADVVDNCPHCRAHVRAAQDAVAAFEAALPSTRRPGAGAAEVRALFRERAAALREMHEVRMRLANDLDAERRWAEATDALDADLLVLIEDARRRCAVPLVHPGPVDDAWYGQWYRAANDAL